MRCRKRCKLKSLHRNAQRSGQAVLPLSPYRDRVMHSAALKRIATERGATTGRNRAREQEHDAEADLLLEGDGKDGDGDEIMDDELDELDREFLLELPEGVRRELLADHRQTAASANARDWISRFRDGARPNAETCFQAAS